VVATKAPEGIATGAAAGGVAGGVLGLLAGVGALANQTVHGGYPKAKVSAALNAAAAKAKAKKADVVTAWSTDAEQRLIDSLRTADPHRVDVMKERLDTAPGSFH